MPRADRSRSEKDQGIAVGEGNAVNVVEGTQNEIDLVELFYFFWGRIWYIVAAVVLGIVISGVYTFFLVTPMYQSTAKLYVLNSNDSVVNLSDLQIGSYLASDYQEVFQTWEVNERVIENLDLPYSYGKVRNMVTVSNPNNTRILYITVKSADAREAMMIANEYAVVVREYIAETMATEAPNILSTALESLVPVSPSKTRNLILGALVGGLVAIGVLMAIFLLDDKIHSTDDILKYTGIPTLAVVPLEDHTSLNPPNQNARRKQAKRKAGV